MGCVRKDAASRVWKGERMKTDLLQPNQTEGLRPSEKNESPASGGDYSISELLEILGIKKENYGATDGTSRGWLKTGGKKLVSYSPVDGSEIATIIQAEEKDYEVIMEKASEAFKSWRMIPAPRRGEIVREIGEKLREHKEALGSLITLEMGKSLAEGYGEVQEMIDIADFSVGLSRQLYGLTMHSERPEHRMYEQWHPLGNVGIITAFNFPAAVWSWNALISAVCGNSNVFKPSSKTPLTAIAIQNIIAPVVDKYNIPGIFNLVIGSGREIGERMINDRRIPLISATGSTNMGRHIAEATGKRLGRHLLELGGNNALIVTENADQKMALSAVFFGAVGTAGQRCTSTRRLIIHKSIKDKFISNLIDAYEKLRIGNPFDPDTHMGPLIDQKAVEDMKVSINKAVNEGGTLVYGSTDPKIDELKGGCYVKPVIIEVKPDFECVQEETFAPLLYVIEYENLEEALEINNGVPQGLSSAIFTDSMRYQEKFLSHMGSDCGIANVNIGTSGAEIGGAFGGEKDTGGGRESGSDSWKIYMRRQTNTINWGKTLPLAQGITFDID